MIVHGQSGEEAIIQNISGIQEMGMKQTAKAFGLLIDKLYTKKEDAVVRELASNARDAMVDAGFPDTPFYIEIPNTICHELVIRDNGTGLSKENVLKYLGTIFESSKESSNKAIGAYGLGSKSPFAVTDSYMIESRFNGELHTFSFFRAKGATPSLVHISTMPTDEPNGLTFRVPSSPSRYNEYKRSVAAQLFFFEPKPIINGLGGQGQDIWADYGKILYDTPQWKVIKSSGLKSYYGDSLACMGGVSYPINTHEVGHFNTDDDFLKTPGIVMDGSAVNGVINKFNKICDSFADSTTVALMFNIGELEVPPSREALEYDTETCYNIYKAMERFNEEFEAQFIADILKASAFVTTAKELKDTVTPFYDILRWSNGDGRYGGSVTTKLPLTFVDRIKALKWDVVNASASMPSYRGRDGQVNDGKLVIGIYDYVDMLKNLSYDMPHIEVPRIALQEISHVLFNGVLDSKSSDIIPPALQSYTLTDTKILSLENNPGFGLGYERVTRRFTKNYTEWVPEWSLSENITPDYSDINLKKPDCGNWTATRIGAEAFNAKTIIIINDAPKKDFRKCGTWAVKEYIAKNNSALIGDEDEETTNDIIRNIRISHRNYTVKALEIYNDEILPDDVKLLKDFFAAQPADIRPVIIWLSEVVVPKAKSANGNVLVFRGVHHAKIQDAYQKQNITEMNTCTFNSIATGQTVQPGFIVFKATETELTYLDPACTIEADEDEIMQVLSSLKRFVDLPFSDLYRLTPMTTKKLHEYEAAGFQRLDTFLKATLSTKFRGSNQFKRRLKHFALAYGMSQNIHFEPIHRYSNSHGFKMTGTVLEFAAEVGDVDTIRVQKYLKTLKHSAKSGSYYVGQTSSMNTLAAFGLAYEDRYKKLTMEEAATIVSFEIMQTGRSRYSWAKDLIRQGRVDYKGKPVRTQLDMIVEGAQQSYVEFVKKYTEDNFKTVLFSKFYQRDSKEYEDALNHLKKVLA